MQNTGCQACFTKRLRGADNFSKKFLKPKFLSKIISNSVYNIFDECILILKFNNELALLKC